MINPPPTTFSEGQRRIFGIAAGIAGVCFGFAAIAAACVVIWGDWPEGLARTRLLILGGGFFLAAAGSIIVTIGLLVGGPVGRVKTTISREQISTEMDKG